jgi:hypothetical protein
MRDGDEISTAARDESSHGGDKSTDERDAQCGSGGGSDGEASQAVEAGWRWSVDGAGVVDEPFVAAEVRDIVQHRVAGKDEARAEAGGEAADRLTKRELVSAGAGGAAQDRLSRQARALHQLQLG